MRLIKNNDTPKYELFYDILIRNSNDFINPNYGTDKFYEDSTLNSRIDFKSNINNNQFLSNHNYFLKIYNSFEKEIEKSDEPIFISNLLEDFVKKIISAEDFSLLMFNENKSYLIPIGNPPKESLQEKLFLENNNNGKDNFSLFSKTNDENEFNAIINHYYNEKILDFVFEKNNPSFLPNLSESLSNDSKLNILIFPIVEKENRKGLLALSTKIKIQNINEIEIQLIKALLKLSFSKIEKYFLQKKIKNIYEELQTYQAKLVNDFHLSTIGELTEGIVEEILSPLQFILSQVELYQSEQNQITQSDTHISVSDDNENIKGFEKIKEKILGIQNVILRLVKFAESSKQKLEIYPCNINDSIAEFYSLIKSSLQNNNIECVLDLEKNIPSFLSHPNYVYQILRNSFNIIKSTIEKDGGILIQTRFKNENIILKIISTSNLVEFTKKISSEIKSDNLNYRMLQNLVEKHEGIFKIDSSQKSGSTITFNFPIKRKLRI
ncbi:MAG: hypothetical protein STSR0008_15420 [Ignavibacterium sp.]